VSMSWDYIAGFFDGEGSVVYLSGKSYRVTFAQSNITVLNQIADFLHEFGIYTWITYKQPTSLTRLPSYHLAFSKSMSVRFFLQQIQDKVIVKKELLWYVLNNLSTTPRHEIPPEIDKKVLELRTKGLSQTAIANRLGISQSAVWRRCHP